MKKIISVLTVLLMILSLTACGDSNDNNGSSSKDTSVNSDSASQNDASGDNSSNSVAGGESVSSDSSSEGEDTDSSKVADGNTSSDSSTGDKKSFTESIKYSHGMICEMNWTATDDKNAVLKVTLLSTATEEDLAGSGLKAPLTVGQTETYTVTYTSDKDGKYTAVGNVSAFNAWVEGESAQAFIDMRVQEFEDDSVMRRILAGEVVTGKEDIEYCLGETDKNVSVIFDVENGKMAVEEIVYQYGKKLNSTFVKEVYSVEASGIRTHYEYGDGLLESRTEYRSDGTREKTIEYDKNGNESYVIKYDENDKIINEHSSTNNSNLKDEPNTDDRH